MLLNEKLEHVSNYNESAKIIQSLGINKNGNLDSLDIKKTEPMVNAALKWLEMRKSILGDMPLPKIIYTSGSILNELFPSKDNPTKSKDPISSTNRLYHVLKVSIAKILEDGNLQKIHN